MPRKSINIAEILLFGPTHVLCISQTLTDNLTEEGQGREWHKQFRSTILEFARRDRGTDMLHYHED
jgi:hypothetical protein